MTSSVFLQDRAFSRLFPAGSFGIWSPESSTWAAANLTDEILPYRVLTAANFVNRNISNSQISSSSETIYTYHHSYDIDFDPVLTGHCMEKTETDVLDDDQEDDNLILLNELFLSE